jgi:hypothetical protein
MHAWTTVLPKVFWGGTALCIVLPKVFWGGTALCIVLPKVFWDGTALCIVLPKVFWGGTALCIVCGNADNAIADNGLQTMPCWKGKDHTSYAGYTQNMEQLLQQGMDNCCNKGCGPCL